MDVLGIFRKSIKQDTMNIKIVNLRSASTVTLTLVQKYIALPIIFENRGNDIQLSRRRILRLFKKMLKSDYEHKHSEQCPRQVFVNVMKMEL